MKGLDCRKACSKMSAFLEGTIPPRKQTSLIRHYQNCDSCREELAVSLVLYKAMHALDDENADFDFINEDQDEAANQLLAEAELKSLKDHQIYYQFTGLKVITFWAIFVTMILQILYWRSIGF